MLFVPFSYKLILFRRGSVLIFFYYLQFFSHVYSKLDLVNMKMDFLNRNVNEGFSGGERKRNEILQLAVCPTYLIGYVNQGLGEVIFWWEDTLDDQVDVKWLPSSSVICSSLSSTPFYEQWCVIIGLWNNKEYDE